MSYSKAYHSYFEGYVEREVLDEASGKPKKERIYAADYYKHHLSDGEWKRLKQRYAMRAGLALAVLAAEGIYDFNGTAGQWYIGGPIGFAALAIVWLCYSLGCYLLAGREMTVRQYRNCEALKTISMGAIIAFALCACGFSALALLHREAMAPAALGAAANIAACISLRGLCREEESMLYERLKNSAQIPGDAYIIKRKMKQKYGG